MECGHGDLQQQLDAVEEVAVGRSLCLAVASVMATAMGHANVFLVPTAQLKADCWDRTTPPVFAREMAQSFVVPVLPVK
jgi:hypothetical protein